MKLIELTVDSEKPVTLGNFLTGRKGVSRRLLTKLKRQEGGITRRGETVRSIDMVEKGDVIVLALEDDSFLEPNGSLNVPIAFENDSLVVFDKPGGMPVHPSIKHQGDTLGNYFAHLYPQLTFRAVNRLDRDTSGLCIIAKDALAAKLLQGSCEKVYYAAVQGLIPDSGTIDAPIARERESIIVRCVREDGQRAVTHYKRLLCSDKYSLAEVHLETGRTHQIRVHFAHIGAPLAGDDLYGGLRDDITRQALHCGSLSFSDPLTGRPITVSSELPGDIKSLFPTGGKLWKK
ncbi:RluA family pseudouridine synthase [Ruminococcus flavefaciens]|uniref:RluA family pseudouridine synthase n=1 Tax=Ruminococcus flavefaciens TaxID=1265 RepID=UPI0003137BFF|nr:RluA family pseudouridine synthase [Ruminococcus flavefaciens]